MSGGRLRLLSCSFTSVELLLHFLLLPTPDVDTYDCQKEFHKYVGDSVEFFPCSPTKNLTYARWDFEEIHADCIDNEPLPQNVIKMSCSQTTFSLTVRELTPENSGDFIFISDVNGKPQPNVIKHLKVHARLKPPELNVSSTWNASSNSCEVSLTCNLTSEDLANYTWTVRSKTSVGSLLRYNLEPEEEEILFNCTAVSVQSGMSASSVKIVKCNGSAADNLKSVSTESLIMLLSLAAVVCLIIITSIVVSVSVRHCRRKHKDGAGNNQTVYADVSDFSLRCPTATMGESLYETVSDPGRSGSTTVANSIYDTVQLSRIVQPNGY